MPVERWSHRVNHGKESPTKTQAIAAISATIAITGCASPVHGREKNGVTVKGALRAQAVRKHAKHVIGRTEDGVTGWRPTDRRTQRLGFDAQPHRSK
ncbi:MAG TPA: hypothetical protein VF265_07715 [Nevskiaceae bacterium]